MTSPTHEVLVTLHNGTRMVYEGEKIFYDGKPDWKLQPLEQSAAAKWQRSTADPARVEHARSIQNYTTRGPIVMARDADE